MAFYELYSNAKNCFLEVLTVGYLVILYVTPVQAADECHFEERESVYCHYGCCVDKCCPMTTIALIGFIVSIGIGLVCVVGCIFCLYCIFKTNKKAARNTAMVHPMGDDYNSKIYHHTYTTDGNQSNLSTVSSESGFPKEQFNRSFLYNNQEIEPTSNGTYIYSKQRPTNY